MAFNHKNITVSDLQTELANLQGDYRNTTRDLANANRKGDKLSAKSLTKAKKRISTQMDTLKNQIANRTSY